MTVQELGDKLQNIAHAGNSLARCYILRGEKLKEIEKVKIVENGNGLYIVLEDENEKE